MKPALIVLDIQNIWLDDNADLKKSVERRLEVINGAITWFRRNQHPVVVVYHEDKDLGLLPGTKQFEVPPEVMIEETDLKASKRYPSAFGKTDLGAVLRDRGCDTVLITGLSASGCVLATYFGAMDFDLKPYLVKNGVASHSEDHVKYAEDLCDTLALDAFDGTLR